MHLLCEKSILRVRSEKTKMGSRLKRAGMTDSCVAGGQRCETLFEKGKRLAFWNNSKKTRFFASLRMTCMGGGLHAMNETAETPALQT
jgi:hypothetical protein